MMMTKMMEESRRKEKKLNGVTSELYLIVLSTFSPVYGIWTNMDREQVKMSSRSENVSPLLKWKQSIILEIKAMFRTLCALLLASAIWIIPGIVEEAARGCFVKFMHSKKRVTNHDQSLQYITGVS